MLSHVLPQLRLRGFARLATLTILGILSAACASAAVITNNVFWKDTSGNNIYSQGGGVFKFGDTYYWYGVKYAGAVTYAADPHGQNSNTAFQAVTCYSSKDLVNWKFENNILTSSTPGLGSTSWIGRIGVFYNANTSRYVLVTQYFGSLGGSGGNLYCTGTSPTSNFSVNTVQYPVPGVVNNRTGDQTVFIDTDGTPYLIASSAEGRSNWYVARFNSNGIGTQTAVRIGGGAGREGNCMFKYNGRYYFCSSDLYGWNASRCYYISATNIMGPYSAEAIMVNSDKDYCHVTQTGFFVTVTGTQGTTVIFCGDRWADFAGNGNGYNQWCPVTFNGTTPIFNSLSKWDFDITTGTWSVAPGNNYVLNPSYEADRISLSWATGWTTTSNSGNSGGNGNGRTGDYFYHHTGTSTTRQTIAVPNGNYTLRVWHRSAGGQSTCRMFARNYGGPQLNTNLNTPVSSWSQRSISNINVTNGSIEIGIESTGAWVDFEDWELTRNDATTLNVSPSTLSFGSSASSQNASISSNTSWTVSDNQSWISVSPTSGSNNATLSVSVTQNTGASRSGTVTVTGGGLTRTISVTQNGVAGGDITTQAEAGTAAGGVTFDSNNSGFNGTGFANFPTSAGTLTFNNVDGNGGGAKTLEIRYANGSTTNRTGTITVNGVTSSVTFEPTGSWATWETITVNVTLNNSTSNTIQFASNGQDLGNIDEITVPGTTVPTPDTYQAEDFQLSTGASVDNNNPGFNGTGFVNFPAEGTLTCSPIDGNGGGTKSLSIRYALGATSSRTGTITVNGVTSSITFPPTGSWTTWTTLTVNITLNNSPSNTIVFASTGQDLANLDEFTVP